MRESKSGFKSNFHQGGSVKKVEISKELENFAVKSVQALGLNIAGVDILIGEKEYIVCEINSSPGYEGFEKATNINCAKEILTCTPALVLVTGAVVAIFGIIRFCSK